MPGPLHSRQETADGIHTAVAYGYANAAARLAATGFVAGDRGKLALQDDDGSLWVLYNHAPPTWGSLGAGSLRRRAGVLIPGNFSGTPRQATVTFASPMPSADYAVTADAVTVNDRSYSLRVEDKTAAGFVVDLGSGNIADLVEVGWTATQSGED